MAEPFLGEIKMVGFTFAPRQWALCDGQLMSISQNTALFSLLGTTFGGDGRTTFALPDMRGRSPVHPSASIFQSERAGTETVTITQATMAQHTHAFNGETTAGTTPAPTGKVYADALWGVTKVAAGIYNAPNNLVSLNADTCTSSGGGEPHANLQPSLAVLFVISLAGIYPSRN